MQLCLQPESGFATITGRLCRAFEPCRNPEAASLSGQLGILHVEANKCKVGVQAVQAVHESLAETPPSHANSCFKAKSS